MKVRFLGDTIRIWPCVLLLVGEIATGGSVARFTKMTDAADHALAIGIATMTVFMLMFIVIGPSLRDDE